MTSTTAPDAAIQVVVTPSQSCYFAGEPFSVRITFTNTRSPDAPPPRTASSHTHKRAAHSISSAPLARPPTSPGTPRAMIPSIPSQMGIGDGPPVRQNLIGKSTSGEKDSVSKGQSRSLSVAIAPYELEEQLKRTASTPHALARSSTLPLGPNHPHARKQSVFDGQQIATPLSPSAAASTFSLSLDPISESSSPSPLAQTPLAASPLVPSASLNFPFTNPSTSGTHSYPPRRPPQIGLGKPPRHDLQVLPRTTTSSSFPQTNAELILYSYAQLSGTLHATPLPGTTPTPDQAHALKYMRSALSKRAVVGGGSMDITSSLRYPTPSSRPPNRRTHSRSASISSGIMSLFSSSVSSPSIKSPLAPTHKGRTLSVTGIPGSAPPGTTVFPQAVGLGIGVGDTSEEEIDPEAPLPMFEEQPTMLAVDLALLPGESRSYTYKIALPNNLPPTFKGRTLRFSYELVIGTCRAGGSAKSSGLSSISRVMKVPIRIYNHVAVGRIPRHYDLLWPVARRIKSPAEANAKVVEETERHKQKIPLSHTGEMGTFEDLQRYSRSLLQSFHYKSSNPDSIRHITSSPEDVRRGLSSENDTGLSGCREAVEILTRNPKKVCYDVGKDGVKVAILTFPKSSYRLGETVFGVVELNDRTGRSRVLKLSAILEARESLPPSISPPSTSRHLRRVHAEQYSAFVASTLRTTFALDIPSDASPAFQVCLGPDSSQQKPGGLEWKVRLCLLVAIASETSRPGTEGVRTKALVRDGPRGVWGSSWRAPASLAPMEKLDLLKLPAQSQHRSGGNKSAAASNRVSRSWAASIVASLLGSGEREYHDGDEGGEDEEENGEYDGVRADKEGGVGVGVVYDGGEEGWQDMAIEMVECEVPISVWPGNTAFKAVDVVFDV
ncbi:Rgp1-domain-containing protein [Pleurotus eryngii]|uniref:Rgp1-domain-containing protein n=1 Tax=Pleurotus eryngii TaxID=5323 RepID=A0A9P5ZNJ3_PLEER|nr:Rgp1-domain-containing protein [Pleurotus eryngii]